MKTKYIPEISLTKEIKKLFEENELAFEIAFPSIGKKLMIQNDFRIIDLETRVKVTVLGISIALEDYAEPGFIPEGIIYCQGNRYLAFSMGKV